MPRHSRLICAVALGAFAACSAPPDEGAVLATRLNLSREAVARLQHDASLSAESLRAMTAADAVGVLRTLRPDMQQRRVRFRNLLLRDADRQIDPSAVWRAIQFFDLMRSPGRFGAAGGGRGGVVFAGPPPEPRNWVVVGPSNFGGRTRSILIDPANPNHLWVGSVSGGIWESQDGGASLTPVDDFLATLAICCMAMDPTDPTTIYVGTGEGFYNGDAIRGAGIFRATRASGGRFELMSGTNTKDMQYMTRVAVTADGSAVLASARNPDGTSAGVFRYERGQSPAVRWPQPLRGELVFDVETHPADSTRAVAGGWGRAWFSTTGGKDWKPAQSPGWEGRVELRYARSRPDVVYALVQGNDGGSIWKSVDGGQSYSRKNTVLSDRDVTILGPQGLYSNVIWVDPTNENIVLAGGIDLWRSTDGGDRFARVSTWREKTSLHADQHTIVAHPGFNGTTNKTVYIGNDGGLYTTADILTVGATAPHTAGWRSLNQTYAATQFYGGAIASTGAVLGGAQDFGNLLLNAGAAPNQWTVASDGDGSWPVEHPGRPGVFIAEYIYLDLFRVLPGQTAVEELTGVVSWNLDGTAVWKDDKYVLPDAKTILNRTDPTNLETETANFMAPFAIDPTNNNILYAGGASVWRTDNLNAQVTKTEGPTWSRIKDPLSAEGSERLVSAMAVHPSNPSVLWVGHNNGRVSRTTNARDLKPGWDDIGVTPGSALPIGRVVTRIVFDPKVPDTVYVTYAGFETTNVWKSTTGGKTWENIHPAKSAMPVFTIAIHPDDSNALYLASELGVFTSRNGGTSWAAENKGPANCSVQDLFWSGRVLFAATHGRGLFKVDLTARR